MPEVKTPRKIATPASILQEERYQLIAIAAYFRAEKRGFAGNDTVQDWLDGNRRRQE